jgi:hypothetical protein
MKGFVMRNRALQIDWVKKGSSQDTASDQPEADLEKKVTIVTQAVERGIRKVGFVVCAYVILDTVRQVVVASTK